MAISCPPRIGKGARLLGTLRNPNYSEQRRAAEARRQLDRAKKRQRVLERLQQNRSWKTSTGKKKRSIEESINALKRLAKKTNLPRRKPVILQKPRPLLFRLVGEQHIGKQWIPILSKMISAGLISLRENTNLRTEIAAAIRPFNSGGANAFAKGRAIYFQKGNQSLENILRNARQKPILEITAKKAKRLRLKMARPF